MNKKEKKYDDLPYSNIAAWKIISESEIVLAFSNYDVSWWDESNPKRKILLKLFYQLGIDTDYPIKLQGVTRHRNQLNKVVTCRRYLGEERQDKEWLNSGYASKEAKDKARKSRITDEIYWTKGLTVDCQVAGEIKDSYISISEEDQLEQDQELGYDTGIRII